MTVNTSTTGSACPSTQPVPARRAGRAVLVLLSVAACWGSTFPLYKSLFGHLPVTDFLAIRYVLAALVLTALFPRSAARLGAADRRHGLVLGLLYGIGQVCSTVGLARTSPSVAGFVTGLYVVLTPIVGVVVLRRRPPLSVWLAVALATAGLAALALHGTSLGPGVPITLLSALIYAGHVVALGHWATGRAVMGLAVLQLWVCAAVCTVVALPGGVVLPSGVGDWAVILYAAGVAGALSMIAQTWAQAQMSAERAAILMTTEPVWAAAFSVLGHAEPVTWRLLVGGALVLAAMALAESGGLPRRGRRTSAVGP